MRAPLSVQTIADAAAASPPHLNRLFRSELGVSVWTHVQGKRLDAVKLDLVNSDAPITELVARYGIKSLPTFNSYFKLATGMTPSEFRSLAGKG